MVYHPRRVQSYIPTSIGTALKICRTQLRYRSAIGKNEDIPCVRCSPDKAVWAVGAFLHDFVTGSWASKGSQAGSVCTFQGSQSTPPSWWQRKAHCTTPHSWRHCHMGHPTNIPRVLVAVPGFFFPHPPSHQHQRSLTTGFYSFGSYTIPLACYIHYTTKTQLFILSFIHSA